LSARGWDVSVFVLRLGGEVEADMRRGGVRVYGVSPGGSRLALLGIAALKLLKLLLAEKPAIVHFFLPESYLLGGVCSCIVTPPVRIMSRRSLNDYQNWNPASYRRLESWLHRRMDAVIGNSRAVVGQLRAEGVPDERLGLLYNGLDVERYRCSGKKDAARVALAIQPGTLVLVMVANLIPYKGHEDLLAALGQAKHRLPPDWVLLCVGRDIAGIGARLAALAADLGIEPHIHWLGGRADVPAVFAAADIGLLTSHHEGFSNSVLEGMATGLPMVVTRVGGNVEAVLDGVTGRTVGPGNPEELANAIVALAEDAELRERFGEAGRRRVEEDFTLDRCIAQYERLYLGLLDGTERAVSDILESAPDH
jgi:glycosyltransferase involved in cell wall biosynthesis